MTHSRPHVAREGSPTVGFLALFFLGWLVSINVRRSKLWPWHRKARARWIPARWIYVGILIAVIAVLAVVL